MSKKNSQELPKREQSVFKTVMVRVCTWTHMQHERKMRLASKLFAHSLRMFEWNGWQGVAPAMNVSGEVD